MCVLLAYLLVDPLLFSACIVKACLPTTSKLEESAGMIIVCVCGLLASLLLHSLPLFALRVWFACFSSIIVSSFLSRPLLYRQRKDEAVF